MNGHVAFQWHCTDHRQGCNDQFVPDALVEVLPTAQGPFLQESSPVPGNRLQGRRGKVMSRDGNYVMVNFTGRNTWSIQRLGKGVKLGGTSAPENWMVKLVKVFLEMKRSVIICGLKIR